MNGESVDAAEPLGRQFRAEEVPKPSGNSRSKTLLFLSLVPVMTTFLVAGILAVSAYQSETAGGVAAILGAPVVGFVWAGFLGVVFTPARAQNGKRRQTVAAFGCGCGGAVLLFFAMGIFMVVIFPAL